MGSAAQGGAARAADEAERSPAASSAASSAAGMSHSGSRGVGGGGGGGMSHNFRAKYFMAINVPGAARLQPPLATDGPGSKLVPKQMRVAARRMVRRGRCESQKQ